MQKIWAGVGLGALLLACKGPGGAQPSPQANGSGEASAAASVSAARPAPASAKSADGCLTELEYLVPPQKYGNADLIRAVLADGDQVFFRNMKDLMRVSLAGGQVATVGKASALSLSGTTQLWQAGGDLVTQSSGEPIFMKFKKSGGEWTTFIDLTTAKLGGGRDVTTRLLQGIGKSTPTASAAAFDGKAFFYAEISRGKGRNAPASSVLKSVSFDGGEPRTLFTSPGEVTEVTRVGEHVAFHLVLPATAEQIKENEALRKKNKYVFGVAGENWVMAVPLAGGEGKRLLRLSSFFSGGMMGTTTILGADGGRLYVSGYLDEDMQKPGVHRIEVASGAVQELDKRFVRGEAYVAGDRVVIIGSGPLKAGEAARGIIVLSVPRDGKSLTLVSCIAGNANLHASAVAGDVALLSLFESRTGLASIAKVPVR